MKKFAVYAGSFDPPTDGHAWMIDQASKMFILTVALADNPEKRTRFNIDDRRRMLESIWDGKIAKIGNQFLANWAAEHKYEVLIRGIRSPRDFEYESTMSSINADISPKITTVFLVPPWHLREVSSSMVMSLVGIKDRETVAGQYVHPSVLAMLKGLKK